MELSVLSGRHKYQIHLVLIQAARELSGVANQMENKTPHAWNLQSIASRTLLDSNSLPFCIFRVEHIKLTPCFNLQLFFVLNFKTTLKNPLSAIKLFRPAINRTPQKLEAFVKASECNCTPLSERHEHPVIFTATLFRKSRTEMVLSLLNPKKGSLNNKRFCAILQKFQTCSKLRRIKTAEEIVRFAFYRVATVLENPRKWTLWAIVVCFPK